ncbi:hypothetical protein C476_14728 [Natrinema limicola JCM 13563]|uniref:Uncharacterized protein n=1 Tax=Natrinema limicola JCM 13563 TaxID=1230457 RepID=M0C331_9EURY|nr:hypothetical protein C476_14728 [Natrinema limicola JCM 13563]
MSLTETAQIIIIDVSRTAKHRRWRAELSKNRNRVLEDVSKSIIEGDRDSFRGRVRLRHKPFQIHDLEPGIERPDLLAKNICRQIPTVISSWYATNRMIQQNGIKSGSERRTGMSPPIDGSERSPRYRTQFRPVMSRCAQ